MLQKKRGFTVVELVIVIAVIAILAAVLIPTFTSLLQKSNQSADTKLLDQINKLLVIKEAYGDRPSAPEEVIDILIENGIDYYDPSVYQPKQPDFVFVWDPEKNRVGVYPKDEIPNGYLSLLPPQPCFDLAFEASEDGSYTVTGIGNCVCQRLIIPAQYNEKPVTAIRENAFIDCTQLKSITIPKSITSVASDQPEALLFFLFLRCSSLEKITVEEGNPIFRSSGNCLIYIPSQTIIRGCKTSVIPQDETVTVIGHSAFMSVHDLVSITIPENIALVDTSAFVSCSNLSTVRFLSDETQLASGVFSESGITEIVFPEKTANCNSKLQ